MGDPIENSSPSDRLETSTGQCHAKTRSPKVEFSVILPSGVSRGCFAIYYIVVSMIRPECRLVSAESMRRYFLR
ncbi:hypothetical protein QUA54_19640 [Microcoleus sp. MOSTC5]